MPSKKLSDRFKDKAKDIIISIVFVIGSKIEGVNNERVKGNDANTSDNRNNKQNINHRNQMDT